MIDSSNFLAFLPQSCHGLADVLISCLVNNWECIDQSISTFQDILGDEVPTSDEVCGTASTVLCALDGFCLPCAAAVESVVDCTVNELDGAGGQSCDIDCSAENDVGNGENFEGADNPEKEENIGPDLLPEILSCRDEFNVLNQCLAINPTTCAFCAMATVEGGTDAAGSSAQEGEAAVCARIEDFICTMGECCLECELETGGLRSCLENTSPPGVLCDINCPNDKEIPESGVRGKFDVVNAAMLTAIAAGISFTLG